MNNHLTEGDVLKVLLTFTLSYLLATFLQSFYGITDIYIAEQFNSEMLFLVFLLEVNLYISSLLSL